MDIKLINIVASPKDVHAIVLLAVANAVEKKHNKK
jgi:uncharacterized protein YbaR (Trm112 family)